MRLIIFVTFFCFLAVQGHSAHADDPYTYGQSVITGDSCDVDYFEILQNRGKLEARRRMTMAQSIIIKPDSVLDYTCFGSLMQAYEAPYFSTSQNMFSEIHGGLCYQNSLHCSLMNLVYTSLQPYLTGNFSEKMLGGRGTVSRDTGNSGICDVMPRVWNEAKCFSFQSGYDSEPDAEGFQSFLELTSNDPRLLPMACASPTIDTTLINETYPAPVGSANFYTDMFGQTTAAEGDIDNMLSPASGAGSCAGPITSGLDSRGNSVFLFAGPVWYDGVCPNPGCHLTKSFECVPTSF